MSNFVTRCITAIPLRLCLWITQSLVSRTNMLCVAFFCLNAAEKWNIPCHRQKSPNKGS